MKNMIIKFLSLYFTIFLCLSIQGKGNGPDIFAKIKDESQHKSYNIKVGKKAFTTLHFPENVKNISISNKDISTFVLDEEKKLVFVQALSRDVAENSIAVLTDDHKLYNFILEYDNSLRRFVYTIDNETIKLEKKTETIKSDHHEYKDRVFASILSARNNIFAVSKRAYSIKFTLLGSYINNDTIYLKLRIKNTTKLKYDIDTFTLYAWDLKDARKREAKTKMFIPIVDVFPKLNEIGPKSTSVIIISFKKVVIANNKSMFIDMAEKNGDRAITLPIRYSSIKNPTVIK